MHAISTNTYLQAFVLFHFGIMAACVDNSSKTMQQRGIVPDALSHVVYDNAAFEDVSNENSKATTVK